MEQVSVLGKYVIGDHVLTVDLGMLELSCWHTVFE